MILPTAFPGDVSARGITVHPDLIKLLAEAHRRDLLRGAEHYRLASSSKAKQRWRNSASSKHPFPIGMYRVRSAPDSVESIGIEGAGL
jgi:hypothetical protein